MRNSPYGSQPHEGRTDAHPEFFGKFAVWSILFMLLLVVAYLAVPRASKARPIQGGQQPANSTVKTLE